MSGEEPRIRTPAASRAWAIFSGVWPPNCARAPASAPRAPSARAISMTLSASGVRNRGGRRIVIGGDRLRVAVDHDGLETASARAPGGHARSNSRTRSPGRCGSARRRGPSPSCGRSVASRPRTGPASRHRSNRDRVSAHRTRAAQVSTRLNTGWTPSASRRRATLASESPVQRREARVRKALLFQPAQTLRVIGGDRPRAPSPRRRRERRSGAGTRGRSGTPRALPRRSRPRGTPGRPTSRRSGVWRLSAASTASLSPPPSGSRGSPPRRGRTSLSRSNTAPFCSDSAKVRPIAIASPTDFMDVVSVASAPGNFSKVKRGILVTT